NMKRGNTVQVRDDNRCFICGKDNHIGFKAEFTIDPERRRAETRVRINEVFQGWQGITHGGISINVNCCDKLISMTALHRACG
ncbi:MAG: hypothetical protein PHH91_07095, partial [Desulfuromonadaceae bacterium]|nr:hypothetical protein [Desulfuromonadaceae bacterium]